MKIIAVLLLLAALTSCADHDDWNMLTGEQDATLETGVWTCIVLHDVIFDISVIADTSAGCIVIHRGTFGVIPLEKGINSVQCTTGVNGRAFGVDINYEVISVDTNYIENGKTDTAYIRYRSVTEDTLYASDISMVVLPEDSICLGFGA